MLGTPGTFKPDNCDSISWALASIAAPALPPYFAKISSYLLDGVATSPAPSAFLAGVASAAPGASALYLMVLIYTGSPFSSTLGFPVAVFACVCVIV